MNAIFNWLIAAERTAEAEALMKTAARSNTKMKDGHKEQGSIIMASLFVINTALDLFTALLFPSPPHTHY